MDDDTLGRRLAAELARAEADLTAASQGASLCRLSRDGGPTGVKFAEGAWAALREATREVGRDGSRAVVDVLGRWQEDLARRRAAAGEAGGPESPWVAYDRGGVDALERVLDPDDGESGGTSGS